MKKLIMLSLAIGAALTVRAQTFELVKDINPGGDAHPLGFTEYNGSVYFHADDGTHGEELWVSDGTEAGTRMVKDIYPGSGASAPSGFIAYNGKLYFGADDGIHGYEFWVSDGTESGTTLLKDINPGSGMSLPGRFSEYNGKLYFVADDGTNGRELWVSDGTEAGTTLLKDINPVGGSNIRVGFTEYNGKLYFYADDSVHGDELWVTDGSSAGTVMVKDINPGSGASAPNGFIQYNGKLYFGADDGIHGDELWVTNGTDTGTRMVKDINPLGRAFPSMFIEYNGKLYFGADDGVHGEELWVTDGTTAGTTLLKDINVGSGSSMTSFFGRFIEYNGKLYLIANDNNAIYNHQIWETDGTAQNTVMIQPLIAPNYNALFSDFGENYMQVINGSLYYNASYNSSGEELWKLTTEGDNVGIEEAAFEGKVSLYPNPVKNLLHLQSTEKVTEINLLSITGQQLQSWTAQNNIDVSAYPSGVYLIQIATEKGRMRQKIVIRK